MDISESYDEFSDLLGVYALDAVEPEESDRIELHLLDCPRCRAEVAEHREVAAYLSQSGASAPEGVWDRIVSELSPPAPPMRITLAPTPEVGATSGLVANSIEVQAPVVPLSSGRSASARSRTKVMVAVVGVAASIVAALGIVAVGQSNRLNTLEDALADQNVEDLAMRAEASPEVKVPLTGAAGSAEAVVTDAGKGYLILDEVAAPVDGSVYQLWGKIAGLDQPISFGTFGQGTKVVPFSVDPERLGDIELFAVTQEIAPGVVASQNDPVLAGTV